MFGDIFAYFDIGCFDALLLVCVEDAESFVSTEAAYGDGKVLLFLSFLCKVPIVVMAKSHDFSIQHHYEE